MGAAADPFSYHPDLRDKISDPLTSPSHTLTTERLATLAKARRLPVGWWYSDSEREAERAETLAGRRDTDLWVFGYGSSTPGSITRRLVDSSAWHFPDQSF